MSGHELAQLNIGIIRGPMDSPVMAEFAANLERINAVAEATPGFVWRLQTEEGDATAIRPFDNENMLVNMSVWKDVESLRRYVYHSAHAEAIARLEHLRRHGPSPDAFTFRHPFPQPGEAWSEPRTPLGDECPAT